MKAASALMLFLWAAAHGEVASAGDASSNPLGTVINLMDSLTAKVIREGEEEAQAYKDYFEWCDDASKNFNFDLQTATALKEKLEALIAKSADDSEASAGKIEELAASIATAEGEVNDATLIREKEAADFAAEEAELVDILSALTRAISIIEREMAKNPAAFAQMDTSKIDGLIKSLSTLVEVASFSTADKGKLLAFAQSQQASEDDDDAPGAPAAAVYKTHSTSIFDVLEDLKEKAEEQLSSLRKAESNAKHNFDLLKSSLEAQIAADTKHMKEEKAAKAATDGTLATAEGDLTKTNEDLATLSKGLETAHANCLTTAADHEATVAARTEELSVIATAKKILLSSTSGAVAQTYSLLQIASKAESGSQLRTRSDLARAEVVALVKRLAREQRSAALAQLASRIAAVLRFGASAGDDPFVKVKGLIQDMIMKLESEAQAAATEKAWCDEQMAKTEEKKSELDDDIAKLTSKIDVASARSASLKAEVKELQGELAALAKLQAEMDKIRSETHGDYLV